MASELFIRLNAMGDILLAIPAVRELANKGISVHWIINKRWQELAPLLPAKVHLYNGSSSLLKLVKELKKLNFSKVHDMQGKVSSIILRNLLGKPFTKYSKRSLSEQLKAFRGIYPLVGADPEPVWKRYANAMDLTISEPNADLELSKDYMAESSNLLKSFGLTPNSYVLIHPGASKVGKEMPDELVYKLLEYTKRPIAIIGTSCKNYNSNNFIDLRNKIRLYHLPGIMKLSSGVVSTDSGPMHLARAVDSKVVAIFFQTCPSLGFEPIPSEKVMIISKPLACKPCSLHGQRDICPENTFACKKMDWKAVAEETYMFMESKK